MKQTFKETTDYMRVLKEIIEVTTDWKLKGKCEAKLKELLDGHDVVNGKKE